MVDGNVNRIALDVGSVLEWMEHQEDYGGSSDEKKAAHWDALKITLAQSVGYKEPQILLFKYRNKDAVPAGKDTVPDELPVLPGGDGEEGEDQDDVNLPDLPEPPEPSKKKK